MSGSYKGILRESPNESRLEGVLRVFIPATTDVSSMVSRLARFMLSKKTHTHTLEAPETELDPC